MSWLTQYVRPKIRNLLGKREVPDNLWVQCDSCKQMIFARDLEKNLNVCPHCTHHMRATATERFDWTFNAGSYTRIELPKVPHDPLAFRDRKKYTERLKDARTETGYEDALQVAHGTIGDAPAVIAILAFEFLSGTMGAAVGEGLLATARLAVLQKAPLVVFTASGGARMQEGMVSLMQMPRSIIARQLLREAKLPYIVVLTNPTTGGVSASFAMLGDVQIAEPNALIGFAGQRVIEQTVRETLPPGFQRAEYLLDHGMLDMVVPRAALPARLATLIALLGHGPARLAA